MRDRRTLDPLARSWQRIAVGLTVVNGIVGGLVGGTLAYLFASTDALSFPPPGSDPDHGAGLALGLLVGLFVLGGSIGVAALIGWRPRLGALAMTPPTVLVLCGAMVITANAEDPIGITVGFGTFVLAVLPLVFAWRAALSPAASSRPVPTGSASANEPTGSDAGRPARTADPGRHDRPLRAPGR